METVEVGLGDVFVVNPKHTGGKRRMDVVVGIGQDDFFDAAPLFLHEGEFVWSEIGTAYPDMVSQIVEQMTVEEVIDMGRRGKKSQNISMSQDMETHLRNEAQRGRRVVQSK